MHDVWLTGNLKIWLYSKPTDMRKSIDGLRIDKLYGNPELCFDTYY